MKVWVWCARGVQVAYVTLHHRGCTLVPPSTWAKRVPRVMSRHKLAIKKGHIMRRLRQAIPEAPQPKPQVPPQQTGNKYGSGWVRGMEGVEDMDKAEDPEGH